jgi:hypothetical protein
MYNVAVVLRVCDVCIGVMTAAIPQSAVANDVAVALQALSTLTTGTSVYGAIASGAITATNTQPVCDTTQVNHLATKAFNGFQWLSTATSQFG